MIKQFTETLEMDNIAESLDQDQIDKIGAKVVEGYRTDKDSRAAWERSSKEVMEIAKLAIKKKTYAGEQVANVKYPIITNSAIQFAARAYPEIIQGTDVVKSKVVGNDESGEKAKRGDRVATHMSYQLLNEMPDWEAGVDQLLITLPVVGCAFKKTYRSSVGNQNISEMVFPDDLVVHYNAVSLEKAARITHVIELSRNEIVERIRAGLYLDFDVDELGLATGETDDIDEDTPHKFLEQHRWYDLDDDGYQEPYIATVHEGTQKLVRLSARFELSGIHADSKQIIKIDPIHYFTRYLFMPSPDGGFYGMGFGSLLHSINSSANTILNQLIDSGTLNNRQAGFLGTGIQMGRGASVSFKSGEWKSVPMSGDDLRKNIVPLPTKEPSGTLFQLLGLLIDTGKELSGITDVLSGQSPGSNVPAETTLALIEQGLQVYSAIHKRIHRSLYNEFQKIRRLNFLYLTDEEYNLVLDEPASLKEDYTANDHDIIPVSDPNATTNMQRIMKAKALLEMRGQGLNDEEINRRYFKALQIEDVDELFPQEEAPNPALELEIQDKQAEIEIKMTEKNKLIVETALAEEKINTEKVNQEATLKGVEFDERKIVIEESQTIDTINQNKKTSDREDVKLISGIRSPKKPVKQVKDSEFKGKSAESNTPGPYREKGSIKSNNKDL